MRRGAVLMCVGEPSDRVFLLIEGQVEVWLEGDSEPIAVREAPTVLGEVGWVLQAPRSATVQARTPVQALSLDGAWLKRPTCRVTPRSCASCGTLWRIWPSDFTG